MGYSAPKGVFDLVPGSGDWMASELWQFLEETIRGVASDFGFREIRTPMFERTELFVRSVGESSDIVSKEMYTFEDKGGRSMSLRPEGTAPVMRALVESKRLSDHPQQKLFYIGPMFRYERPQAGRYRQHHQFGVEAIGHRSPEQDVEVMDLLLTLFRRLELKNLSVVINCIGSEESRSKFRSLLREYLLPNFSKLSEDSQRRFETNPLRILDSKDKGDRELLRGAPSILDALDSESSDYFARVQKLLTALGVSYRVDPNLVRGLDYYNGTVFEVMTEDLGAQNSVGGGGRYDGLIKELGGPDLPSIGFGSGMERILQTMLGQAVPVPEAEVPTLFLIPLGEEATTRCFRELHELRDRGIPSEMDFSGRKLKKVMAHANKLGAKYVAVVGEEEVEKDEVELKEMATGESIRVPISDLSLEVLRRASDDQTALLRQVTGQLASIIETTQHR